MITFDEMRSKEALSTWWAKMLVDTDHSYPMVDFSTIDETFKMDTCVDIGCNVGAFSYLASSKFKKVVSFEPGYYTSIIARTRLNQKERIKNVFVHNLAVGKNTGDIVKLGCDVHGGERNSGNSSVVYESSIDEYELVTTVSLEKVFELCETDFIDYLKVDCEGSEYDILLGKDLSNIGIIVGEVHRHPNKEFEVARKELLDYLSKNFSIVATRHNFFAVNTKFKIQPSNFFSGVVWSEM